MVRETVKRSSAMWDTKKKRHAPEGRKAWRTFPSKAIIKQIAKVYDGQTHTIDALVKRYGLERHQVSRAAWRGGYKTKRQGKSWTEAENAYLRDHWGRTPADEIATALGRTLISVQLQKKRLGISTRDFDDWTIRDLEDREHGLGIDHRLLHRFISRGWLRARAQPRSGAVPVTRVSIDNYIGSSPNTRRSSTRPKSLATRAACSSSRDLPPPPRYKLLTCRSESWQDQIKPTPIGPKVHHGDVRLADKLKELILWRRGSESNRRTRLCRPLHDHSATPPRIVQLPRRGRDVRKKKRESALAFPRNLGAGNESRTRDLNLGKVALYQLSYSRERIGILLGRRNDGQARSPLAKACGAASFR